jgi:hypothetical protein
MDIVKLKKAVTKAQELAEIRKMELSDAIERYGDARALLALAREELENAEALQMARELRRKAE